MTYLTMVFMVLVHLGLMPVSAGIEQTESYATRLPFDIYEDVHEELATPECLTGLYWWLTGPITTEDLEWFHSEDSDCVVTETVSTE